jgi:hypothetical protein
VNVAVGIQNEERRVAGNTGNTKGKVFASLTVDNLNRVTRIVANKVWAIPFRLLAWAAP